VRLGMADDAAGGTPRPFSRAVRAGDFILVSGQVPTRDGEVVGYGIIEQTEQMMCNHIDVLVLAGCTLADVVKVNVWQSDARDFTSVNLVFSKYLIDAPPERSTVCSSLMVDARVEMDVTAYKPV